MFSRKPLFGFQKFHRRSTNIMLNLLASKRCQTCNLYFKWLNLLIISTSNFTGKWTGTHAFICIECLKNKQMTCALSVGKGCVSGFATGSFMVIHRNRYVDAYGKGHRCEVATFIWLEREESLTQPSSAIILKITDSEKLQKLFNLRRQFTYKSSYSFMSS